MQLPELGDHESHVWRVSVPGHVDPQSVAALDAGELGAMQRLRFERDRIRYATRHAALRAVLARYLDLAPAAITFDRTCVHCGALHGKPRVNGLDFSMSSSGQVAVIAVTRTGTVGVDVEVRGDRVVDRAFAASERRCFETDAELLQVWCCKEAVLKATGHGFAIDPCDVVIGRRGDQLAVVDAPVSQSELLAFTLHTLAIGPDVAAALATRPDRTVRLFDLGSD